MVSKSEFIKAVKIFLSYAENDRDLLEALIKQLYPLQQEGLIEHWHRGKIHAGSDWRRVSESYLNSADLILLLISPDFVASDGRCEIEMRKAMHRHENEEARVIPIILRPTDWVSLPCGSLGSLPSDAKPVVLWQNRDAAFSNIVDGIKKVVSEVATTVTSRTSGKTPRIWTVPYRSNPFFTGRAELLTHLYQDFKTSTTQEQVLTGLGGIGKTQVAVEYAYRYKQDYQAVLWVRADSLESMVASLITLAHVLKLPEQHETDQQIITAAIKRWLQRQTHWLLVLDNVEDFEMVHNFLPFIHEGHVLMTTRAEATGSFAFTVHLPKLSEQESALLLLRRSKMLPHQALLTAATESSISGAQEIAQALDGLPLALDQAGAYIDETRTSLSNYLTTYNRQSQKLLQRRGKLAFDHPQSVAVTFALAFERVQQTSPVSADLLCLFAFLHPDAIPEEFLTQGAGVLGPELQGIASDTFDLDTALEELLKFSLVRRHAETKTLSLHRLVQATLKSTLQEEQQRLWAERAVRVVSLLFPHSGYGVWNQYSEWSRAERYLSNAQVCVQFIDQWGMQFAEAVQLLQYAGQYFYERALYKDSEQCLEKALTLSEQVLGAEHPTTPAILTSLGALRHDQGHYTQAEPLLERACAIYEQILPPEHPDLATALNELGFLNLTQGKYNESEQHFSRALAIREHSLGANHPDTATTINNLAGLCNARGKVAEAEPLLRRALAIRELALGAEHPYTALSLGNLANYYYRTKTQYELAESLFLRALEIREQTLGPEHPSTIHNINGLAQLYSVQNKDEQAEPLFLKALALQEEILGPDHPSTAICLNSLGMLYLKQDKDELAEPLLERALHIREQSFVPEHILIALSLYHLALVRLKQKRNDEARSLLRRAVAIREAVLGPDHPDTLTLRELLQEEE